MLDYARKRLHSQNLAGLRRDGHNLHVVADRDRYQMKIRHKERSLNCSDFILHSFDFYALRAVLEDGLADH